MILKKFNKSSQMKNILNHKKNNKVCLYNKINKIYKIFNKI